MRKASIWFALAVAAALHVPTSRAQEHQHSHGDAEDFGTVNFPTSCSPEVAREFTRAVALLHSFGYEEARRSFEVVAKRDAACGMASWGIAMTYYHPIWAPPTPEELAAGNTAAKKAEELGGRTERERGYIAAIGAFYRDAEKLDHRTRARAYSAAIEELSRRIPDDHEAMIFYALSLLATAPPSDATFASQKKAARILNGLLPVEPNHPGIAHYMIHAFDYPPLAQEALPAARAYARIAPSSPHALHMPSHIFTRLGLWQESIDSNLASADAGRKLVAKRHPGGASFDALHALDYLEYAYLQIGDEAAARRVLEEAATAKTFDEPNFAAGYALAAIPVRWALERRDWKTAAGLVPPSANLPWERFPYTAAINDFALAIGSARTGRLDPARAAVAGIEKTHAALAKSPVPGPYDWASQVESMRLAALSWVTFVEGKKEEAVKIARSAAELEEKVGKHPVTPGAILPARELLGDLLMAVGRPAESIAEYEASLREAPNRFNSLYGAARAAELATEPDRAREYYAKLLKQSVEGSPRPELAEARRYLSKEGKVASSTGERPLSAASPSEAQGLLDDLPKASGVRPPPEHPSASAGQTGEEGVVVEPGFGREPVEDKDPLLAERQRDKLLVPQAPPCSRLSAACFSAMLVAAPRAIPRTSASGRVGRMRRANVGGVFGLWTSAVRTSTLAAHWFVLRINSAV